FMGGATPPATELPADPARSRRRTLATILSGRYGNPGVRGSAHLACLGVRGALFPVPDFLEWCPRLVEAMSRPAQPAPGRRAPRGPGINLDPRAGNPLLPPPRRGLRLRQLVCVSGSRRLEI